MYQYEIEMARKDMADQNKLNYRKFNMTENEGDFTTSERTFSGRMTKLRWSIISKFCRLYSYRIGTGSEYDCTGQLVGHYLSFSYQKNQVVITLRRVYDL